jgi:hypothetical protein
VDLPQRQKYRPTWYFLYKRFKINHLRKASEKTDGGFRNNEFYG